MLPALELAAARFALQITEAARRDVMDGSMHERIAVHIHQHGNTENPSEYAVEAADDRRAVQQIAGSLVLSAWADA